MAEADQKAAQATFLSWVKQYVPAAEHININSGLQIRQLLFPDADAAAAKGASTSGSKSGNGSSGGEAEGEEAGSAAANGVRMFKALNPAYDAWTPGSGGKRPRRHLDVELHGLWGAGHPGRIPVEVKTAKGFAAVSLAVLRSLAGKPGAAKKALAKLRGEAEEAARAKAAAAEALAADELDTLLAEADEAEAEGASGAGAAVELEDVGTDGGALPADGNADGAAALPADGAAQGLPPPIIPVLPPAEVEALQKVRASWNCLGKRWSSWCLRCIIC